MVEVRLAPALDPSNIREGEDVYFECHIRANPEETRVLWLHEVRKVKGGTVGEDIGKDYCRRRKLREGWIGRSQKERRRKRKRRREIKRTEVKKGEELVKERNG